MLYKLILFAIANIAILQLTILKTDAFTVYDCQSPATTFQTLDITSPAECPDPDSFDHYSKPKTYTFQIFEKTIEL